MCLPFGIHLDRNRWTLTVSGQVDASLQCIYRVGPVTIVLLRHQGLGFISEHHYRSDFVPLVNILGTLYQIRDDYVNLCSEEVYIYIHESFDVTLAG